MDIRLTVDVNLQAPALVDAIYLVARAVTTDLKRELATMSGTLTERMEAATAALVAQVDAMKAGVANVGLDVVTLQRQIAELQAQMVPGSTITEAHVVALESLVSGVNDVSGRLNEVAAQTPDAPVVEPPPVEEPPAEPTP